MAKYKTRRKLTRKSSNKTWKRGAKQMKINKPRNTRGGTRL